jgi:hypothetical protein
MATAFCPLTDSGIARAWQADLPGGGQESRPEAQETSGISPWPAGRGHGETDAVTAGEHDVCVAGSRSTVALAMRPTLEHLPLITANPRRSRLAVLSGRWSTFAGVWRGCPRRPRPAGKSTGSAKEGAARICASALVATRGRDRCRRARDGRALVSAELDLDRAADGSLHPGPRTAVRWRPR